MDENKIIPYIEPIFRFCCKRLSNRYDAEDLAGEIICHILDGINKYQIESLDAWVWRIAYNRYARFIDTRNKNQAILSCDDELFDIADYSDSDEDNTREQYETIFRYLHTLSSEYKNIFVDYYIVYRRIVCQKTRPKIFSPRNNNQMAAECRTQKNQRQDRRR